MTVIEQVTTLFYGYRCDKKVCGAEWRLHEPFLGHGDWRPEIRTQARADGWTFWASRSRYTFCPNHGPSRGSKMSEVTS